MQMQPYRLLRFRNRIELEFLLSLPLDRLQNGPRCKGFDQPRRNGAPLTAPGRSEETLPDKRERRIRKPMTPASEHLAQGCARRLEATCLAAGGWMPKLFAASSSRRSFFWVSARISEAPCFH